LESSTLIAGWIAAFTVISLLGPDAVQRESIVCDSRDQHAKVGIRVTLEPPIANGVYTRNLKKFETTIGASSSSFSLIHFQVGRKICNCNQLNSTLCPAAVSGEKDPYGVSSTASPQERRNQEPALKFLQFFFPTYYTGKKKNPRRKENSKKCENEARSGEKEGQLTTCAT
jgi:hypothetical protein